MKSKHLLLMLLLALLAPWAANAQEPIPYNEGFESYSSGLPTGWTKVGSGTVTVQTSYVHEGTNSLKFSGATSNVVALPLFTDGGNAVETNTLQITIYTRPEGSYSSSKDFDVGYITDLTDASTFVTVETYNYNDFGGAYGERGPVSMASAPDGAYIAFRHRPSSTAYYWFVDDITVEAIPACPFPSGLQASGVTHDEATITWTSTESAWQVVYSTEESFDPNAASPISVTSPSCPLSGLTPLTDYYVYVRSNCTASGNGYSAWSNKFHFSTSAVATVVGDSWSDDFEGTSCDWEFINGTLANNWCWGTATSNGGTHSLYVSNDGGATTNYDGGTTKIFATKLLQFADGKYEFSFDWLCKGESTYDFLRVALVPASITLTAGTDYSTITQPGLPSGWIALDGGKLNLQESWQNKSVAINVAAGNYYLVLAWRNDSGVYPPAAAVDNVSITKIACDYDVEGLEVSNITTTTADIAWTNSEAGAWQVAVKAGAGEWEILPSTYNSNGATLTLVPSTSYQVRVRAYCDADHQGSWCNPISFVTECDVISAVGYSENFDSYTTGNNVLPICWSYINTTTNSSYAVYPRIYPNGSWTTFAHSAPNCLYLYSYGGSTTYDPQPQYAILPEMSDLAGKQITLQARGYTAASTFMVGTMSDPADASTFTAVTGSPDNPAAMTTSYQEYTFYIPSTTTDRYVAIMIEAANSSRTSNGVYIDDLEFSVAPTCWQPQNLTASDVTNESATLTWNRHAMGDETAWVLQYSTDNTFATATTVSVNTNPTYTIDGALAATTTYYVRVKPACDNDGNLWSETINFTTEASCMVPNQLAVSNVTAHEATLTWNGNNDHFVVERGAFDNTGTPVAVTYMNEGFESGSLPEGWSRTGSYWQITSGTGNSNYTGAATGSYNAGCYIGSYDGSDILVTPVMNLSSVASATLDFKFWNTAWGSDVNTLNVYYRVDGGAWNLLYTDDQSNSEWTPVPTINLTGLANNYQIGFECESNYSYGMAIDDIVIEAMEYPIAWTVVDNNVPYDANANTYTFENLDPETTYMVRVSGKCGEVTTEPSAYVPFTTTIACPQPNNLNVAANADDPTTKEDLTWVMTGAETDWQISCLNGAVENIIDINESDVSINPTTHVVSYTLTGLIPGQVYTVKVRANCEASVPGDQTSDWSNTQNFQTEATCVEPTAFANSNVDAHNAPLSWTEAGTATQWQICINDDMDNLILISNTTTGVTVEGQNVSYTLTSLTAETDYTVKLRAYCADGDGNQSPWVTTSFTTLVACPAPTNPQVEANALDATFSWEGEAGSYEVVTSMNSSDDPSDLVSTPVTGNNYIFTNLELGNHYFWVRSNCSANDEGYSTWAGPFSVHIGYCVPSISSIDGTAISNVTFGTGDNIVNNNTASVKYGDYTAQIGSVQAGVEATVSITYGHQYTYGTFIWVDFDNSLTFDDDEVVYYGQASGSNPHTLNATFTIPATQATGDYVMRIGGIDVSYGHADANSGAPCYSGNWGAFQDYTLRLLEAPSCVTPTDLAATVSGNQVEITWTSEATAFNIDINGTVIENVTSPYTFTGALATEYEVKVQTNCGTDGTSEWTSPANFTTDFCMPENKCEITFELTDTYGDSWNGNYISVVDVLTNIEFAQLTNEDLNGTYGSDENELNTINLPVCDGREIQFQYHIGDGSTYPNENSWVIKDVNDEIIWEGQGSDGESDQNYTVSCAQNSSFTKSIEANSWYAISSPVNTPAVTAVENLIDVNYDFYRYDEASATWENYKAHSATDFTTFENGRGYIYRNSTGNDLTFTGVPNTAANYPYLLTTDGAGDLKGFNLLGNPFATSYTYSGNCYALTEKGTWMAMTNYTIPVCEAVLVKVSSAVNYPYLSTKSAPKAVEALAFTVSGNGYEDVTYAMLEEGEGLTKVAHLAEDAPALSIPVDGSNYAIAYLGYEVESFPLTLNAQAGEYTIALNNQVSGLSYCHLLDKETGKETDLLKGAYTFKANGNSDRFTVLLNASLENGEIAIWNGNSWIVNGEGTLQVFDVMGRRVYNQEVAGQSSLNTDELATGVYVIRLGEKSQKIVVK